MRVLAPAPHRDTGWPPLLGVVVVFCTRLMHCPPVLPAGTLTYQSPGARKISPPCGVFGGDMAVIAALIAVASGPPPVLPDGNRTVNGSAPPAPGVAQVGRPPDTVSTCPAAPMPRLTGVLPGEE